jgi:hypothetical protein
MVHPYSFHAQMPSAPRRPVHKTPPKPARRSDLPQQPALLRHFCAANCPATAP